MKPGDRIESVGKIDWEGYTGQTGPRVGRGEVVTHLDTMVIVEWGHLRPLRTWMPVRLLRLVGPLEQLAEQAV